MIYVCVSRMNSVAHMVLVDEGNGGCLAVLKC